MNAFAVYRDWLYADWYCALTPSTQTTPTHDKQYNYDLVNMYSYYTFILGYYNLHLVHSNMIPCSRPSNNAVSGDGSSIEHEMGRVDGVCILLPFQEV